MEATLKKQNGRPGLRDSWARRVPSLNSHKKREERMDPIQAAWDFMMLQKVLEAAVLELYDRQ